MFTSRCNFVNSRFLRKPFGRRYRGKQLLYHYNPHLPVQSKSDYRVGFLTSSWLLFHQREFRSWAEMFFRRCRRNAFFAKAVRVITALSFRVSAWKYSFAITPPCLAHSTGVPLGLTIFLLLSVVRQRAFCRKRTVMFFVLPQLPPGSPSGAFANFLHQDWLSSPVSFFSLNVAQVRAALPAHVYISPSNGSHPYDARPAFSHHIAYFLYNVCISAAFLFVSSDLL